MAKPEAAPARPRNRLLGVLPPEEYERVRPLLRAVPLALKRALYQARAEVDHVYFPESGVVSAMTVMSDGSAIEVATIGREGMAGLTAFLGSGVSPHEVNVQVSGEALRMSAGDFRTASSADGPLRQVLFKYNTAFYSQNSYAVACNGLHTVEKRCCRWLLMTRDRVGSDEVPLTHELLAIMLGVRRPTVTEVLKPLQERGLVRCERGKVVVLDGAAVEAAACECYRAVRDEFDRLFS